MNNDLNEVLEHLSAAQELLADLVNESRYTQACFYATACIDVRNTIDYLREGANEKR